MWLVFWLIGFLFAIVFFWNFCFFFFTLIDIQLVFRAIFEWLWKKPIWKGADSVMNQPEFLAINCKSLKAQEKSRVQSAIAFGFAPY